MKEPSGGKQEVILPGREGSARNQDWALRIARWCTIVELEQQLKLIDDLMQRQQERSYLFDRDFSEKE